MLHNRVDVELPDRKPAAAHHTPDDLEPVGHLAVRGQVAQQGGCQQVPVAPLLLVRVRVPLLSEIPASPDHLLILFLMQFRP